MRLDAFYAASRAREGGPGRPATDPKILIALWLDATIDGVGSARELDRLCQHYDAYRWTRGGVSVNSHTLSDVRVQHRAALDDVLTPSIAALVKRQVIMLVRWRTMGRTRAPGSRRRPTLEAALHLARVEEALAEMPAVEATKACHKSKGTPRVSTTDAEARVMKMTDGRFVTRAAIKASAGQGVTLYAPVPKLKGTRDPVAACRGDSPAVIAWRARMATDEAQALYRARAATAEWANADTRTHHTLGPLIVRGVERVQRWVLWIAVAHNMMRAMGIVPHLMM